MVKDASKQPQAANDLFEATVQRIKTAYTAFGHQLGWRFLNCSRTCLKPNVPIAVITLNPAGKEKPEGQPATSCEHGHSYLKEQWGSSEPGRSSLQTQFQKLFDSLNRHFKTSSADTLMEESLAGYYIPFRSPRLEDLAKPKEAFKFAASIWTDILTYTSPKLIICIDKNTFNGLQNIYTNSFHLKAIDAKALPTGWGKYTADIYNFGRTRILRLPHLSTFKLFSSDKCTLFVRDIINEACLGLDIQ